MGVQTDGWDRDLQLPASKEPGLSNPGQKKDLELAEWVCSASGSHCLLQLQALRVLDSDWAVSLACCATCLTSPSSGAVGKVRHEGDWGSHVSGVLN